MAKKTSVASRGIKLARRPEGVTHSRLSKLPGQIGSWFEYLRRNATPSEWVERSAVVDGDATYRVYSKTAKAMTIAKPKAAKKAA